VSGPGASAATAAAAAKIPVLMYHEIAGRQDTASRLAVTPEAFASQLAYLSEQGFTTISVAKLASALAGEPGRLPDRPVVITFDDGFADFHGAALPVLRRYGFTATVFVTTGWIADSGPHEAGNRPGRMMSWSQIREAADAGIELGAHSHSHPQLDQLSAGTLRDELVISKALLEDGLGRAVSGLAYPYGYSNARVRRVAREVGYAHACAVGNTMAGSEQDAFAQSRLTIRRSTSLTTFGMIVTGKKESVIFLKDHSLTKGYAVVRRGRAILGGVSRGA
jgi:peptidoglycan/xylan/chitin deacetylase (PgdA/CDA1 family)